MKFLKSSVFLILLTSLVHAQDSIAVKKNQFKIDLLFNSGVTYEYGLTSKSTLFSEIGLGLGYVNNDYYGSYISLSPYAQEQYRYYTGLVKRAKKGKNVARNSGNYFGVGSSYYFVPIGHKNENIVPSLNFTLVRGMQRTYKSGFNLGLEGGLAYVISKSKNDGLEPYLNFSIGLGYWKIKRY